MKKYLLLTFIFSLILNIKFVSAEIFIEAKINNEIISNIDVKNEKNYLLALNPNLRGLSSKDINRYAKDSLVNEKIKKIEIEKQFEIMQNEIMINNIIRDLYSGIGISNINEFEKHLSDFGINLDLVKKKISIEIAWNDYIFNRYGKLVQIDEKKIRDKIKKLSKKNNIENFLLSEIIFTINESENLEGKFMEIKKSIEKIGFEESAKIYSVSESKKDGGKIGWIYKSQLSKKILKEIEKINVGELTNPITTTGGFILLKINEKKNQLLEIDEEEEFKKAVNFEKNRQLTMYSTLQYKRAYNKALINEF
tara:strand:- start:6848 stop:7774 length:927 start_codon:yes stop_codon:yes gene_type:complete